MHTKLVVIIVGLFLAGWGSVGMAQQDETQLQLVATLHINPGKVAEFEAGSRNRHARMATANVIFQELVGVNEDGVYTYVTPLGDGLAAWDMRSAQLAATPPPDNPGLDGIIDHIGFSVRRTRPELSTVPADASVPVGEAGFIHGVSLYLKPGMADEADAVVAKARALANRTGVKRVVLVSSQVIGPDTPLLVIQFFARDAADYYAQAAKAQEMMGDEYQALLGQLFGLARRVETSNITIRRDMFYQPAN